MGVACEEVVDSFVPYILIRSVLRNRYVGNGLGLWESKDPPTVRLNFEPNGPDRTVPVSSTAATTSAATQSSGGGGGGGDDAEPTVGPDGEPLLAVRDEVVTNPTMRAGIGAYYLTAKENRCVVCGATQHYVRFNLVPRIYSKHLPDAFKSHRSHDVLLLCMPCHHAASAKSEVRIQQLAVQHNLPLKLPDSHSMQRRMRRVMSAKKAAQTVLKHGMWATHVPTLPRLRHRRGMILITLYQPIEFHHSPRIVIFPYMFIVV